MTSAPTTKSHSQRDARETLLRVGGEVFSERGYENTTIKEITDRAALNVASVNYYFRDKLGLYTEVLRQCIHNGRLSMPADCARLTPEARLSHFIHSFMKSLVAAGRPGWSGSLMIRELAEPTAALPQIVEDIIRPNFELLRELVAEVAVRPLEEEKLWLLTHSVIAQCAHWKMARAMFPYLWPELVLGEEEVERIADHIAAFSIAGIREAAR